MGTGLHLCVIFGIQVNAFVECPENLHKKFPTFYEATYYREKKVASLIVNRHPDINIRDGNNNTALLFAAESGSVDIMKLLEKGMSVNLTNTNEITLLQACAQFGCREATKAWLKEVLL